MRVTVKSCFPPPGSRETDYIIIVVLIRHIHHDNDAVGWALFVPTMESNDLGAIVKMIEMGV